MRHAGPSVEAAPRKASFRARQPPRGSGKHPTRVAHVHDDPRTPGTRALAQVTETEAAVAEHGHSRYLVTGDGGESDGYLHLQDGHLHLKDVLDHIESAAWGSAGAGQTDPAARRGPA